MNKRFEKIWQIIEVLIVYIFSGFSIGIAINVKDQFPIIILSLIYAGSILTVRMLTLYCKKNDLKIFGKPLVWIIGAIFWTISMFSITYIKTNY